MGIMGNRNKRLARSRKRNKRSKVHTTLYQLRKATFEATLDERDILGDIPSSAANLSGQSGVLGGDAGAGSPSSPTAKSDRQNYDFESQPGPSTARDPTPAQLSPPPVQSNSSSGGSVQWHWPSDDDSLPCLVTEPEENPQSKENVISGRRIVNIPHLMSQLIPLVAHGLTCTTGRMEMTSERRAGLLSTLTFQCSKEVDVTTEEDVKANELNNAFVWGALSIGIGHSQAQELMAVIEVPIMAKRKWDRHEEVVGRVWESKLKEYMLANGVREREIANRKGNLLNGVPFITVIVDGGWSKRSYGHAYNASSGLACIIGSETNGLLYLGVCNKYCYICCNTKEGEAVPEHRCYKNFDGPSTSMEQKIIVEGFSKSIEMHGLVYKYIVGDGDSSVYARIQQGVSYGRSVVKLECANHIVRGYTDKLHKLRVDTTHPLSARKHLTKAIPRLTQAARSAIASCEREGGNVQVLRQDLINGPCHVFGDHVHCRETFCKRKYLDEENMVPFMKACTLRQAMRKALEPIVSKADRLTRNVTTNQAERMMSLVAMKVGGKHVDHTKRGGYGRRVAAAGLAHMKGPDWHRSPLKALYGHSPGQICKKVITARKRKTDKHRKRVQAKRQLPFPKKQKKKASTSAGPDADYGPAAAEPDISAEEMKQRKEAFLAKLASETSSAEAREKLERATVGQSGNPTWREARRDRLTASMFGPICNRRPYTSCSRLVMDVVHPRDIRSDAITYGRIHESDAIQFYEEKRGVLVDDCGLFVDPDHPYLGASPDGLVGTDRLVEVKCVPSLNKEKITIKAAAAAKRIFVSLRDVDKLEIKSNHRYFFQIQGQLNITRRQFCDLVIYTDHDQEILTIERDQQLWTTHMLPKLQQFYLECILPEIVDSRYLRNLQITDPSFIKNAQIQKAKQDADKTAKASARQEKKKDK